jgi:UDP-glucose 4-epimerase
MVRNPARLTSLEHPKLSCRRWSAGDPVESNALSEAHAVLHLAAYIPPDYSDPGYLEECMRVNAFGALDLARRAVEAGVRRFVLFSSGQIYSPGEAAATEGDPVFPAHRAPYYLSSKLAAEIYLEHYRVNGALRTSILRIGSVYGPGMQGDGVLLRFASRARAGLPIEVHDAGRYTIDLVYVDDVVRATLLVLERSADGTFNVGSGKSTSTLEIAHAIIRTLGMSQTLIAVRPPIAGSPRGFRALDISKAKRLLGYSPLDLRQGLEKWLRPTQMPEPGHTHAMPTPSADRRHAPSIP